MGPDGTTSPKNKSLTKKEIRMMNAHMGKTNSSRRNDVTVRVKPVHFVRIR